MDELCFSLWDCLEAMFDHISHLLGFAGAQREDRRRMPNSSKYPKGYSRHEGYAESAFQAIKIKRSRSKEKESTPYLFVYVI